MTQTETLTWWEPIFTGAFALGLNKEKLSELDEEAFLYFTEELEETEKTI